LTSINTWDNDTIQFPRLIAEMEQAGLFSEMDTDPRWKELFLNADLFDSEIYELVDRATEAWDKIKAVT